MKLAFFKLLQNFFQFQEKLLKFQVYNFKLIFFLIQAISTENFFPLNMLCLYQFKFIYPLENKNYYNYEIVPLNNYGDTKTFYVNKTIDCLSVKLTEGLETNRVNYISTGLHVFNVTVNDNYKRADKLTCSIYVIKSCNQLSYVITNYDVKKTFYNKQIILRFVLVKIIQIFYD